MGNLMCCNELMHEVDGYEEFEVNNRVDKVFKYFFCFKCKGYKVEERTKSARGDRRCGELINPNGYFMFNGEDIQEMKDNGVIKHYIDAMKERKFCSKLCKNEVLNEIVESPRPSANF